MEKIPEHLGLIPDGNRRWAQKNDVAPRKGHQRGFDTFVDFCHWCKEKGIETLTAYGFSTENWNRPEPERKYLMKLFEKGFKQFIEEDQKLKNVRIKVIGNRDKLPKSLQGIIKRVEDLTESKEKLKLNIAISYGGRWDIKQAVEKIVKQVREDQEKVGRVDSELIKEELQLRSYPDLIIRTGGEKRLSNFLTWQSAYAELFFSDKLWPDFSERDLEEVLKNYAERKRRFGE